MIDNEGFTTDFTQFCKTRQPTGTEYPVVWPSKSLVITEDRVHNGDTSGEAWHYGIRAKLVPSVTRGLIYQLVESDTVVRYENGTLFTEKIQYLEAWVVYPQKPHVYDYLTNERNGQGGSLYTIGSRTIYLTTWFVAGQNTTNLKQLGFSKDIEPANGLWGTLHVGICTPSTDAIRRRVDFKWDYIDNMIDVMWSRVIPSRVNEALSIRTLGPREMGLCAQAPH